MPKYNQADTNRNDYMDSVSRGDIVGARSAVIEGHKIDLDTALVYRHCVDFSDYRENH